MKLSKKDKAAAKLVTDFMIEHNIDPEDFQRMFDAMVQSKMDITPANLMIVYKHWTENYAEWESKIKLTREEISGWSSAVMAEKLKDPELAEQINYVLNKPVKPEAPKLEPTPKYVPPVRSAEEIAIEKMSAADMKRVLADPVKARGIEKALSKGKR